MSLAVGEVRMVLELLRKWTFAISFGFAIAREEIDHQKIQKLTDATTESFRFGVTRCWRAQDERTDKRHVYGKQTTSESKPWSARHDKRQNIWHRRTDAS
ncbi:hypothetical protein JHK86_010628 [Glycine max]|nr:hypothetical protein JHK86_010628 [Glycine max]